MRGNEELFLSNINSSIEEFYYLETGVVISDPFEAYRFQYVQITRKEIKHIVERRKSEGKDLEEIRMIFSKIPQVIMNPEIKRSNRSEIYINSLLLGRFFKDIEKGIIVILDKENKGIRDIITTFTKRFKDYESLRRE